MRIDDEHVMTLDDLKGDLARRYKWTPSSGASVDPAIVDADIVALDHDGYVIWENVLGAEECQQIRDAVLPGSCTPDATRSKGGAPSASTAP